MKDDLAKNEYQLMINVTELPTGTWEAPLSEFYENSNTISDENSNTVSDE